MGKFFVHVDILSQIENLSQANGDLNIPSQIGDKKAMKDKLIFTNTLRFWLDNKRITQAELANRLGVNPNLISQYKTGTRTPPMDKLEELTKALGLSLPEFFSCQDGSLPEIVFVDRVKAPPRPSPEGLSFARSSAGFFILAGSLFLDNENHKKKIYIANVLYL